LEPDPQAYAELIRGEAELARNRPSDAIRRFQAAKKIADTWAGRLDLGKSYLAANAFPEADTELETCAKRRGEATALFLDESPSFRVFPPALYDLGLARDGLRARAPRTPSRASSRSDRPRAILSRRTRNAAWPPSREKRRAGGPPPLLRGPYLSRSVVAFGAEPSESCRTIV
jgi:hypothetical protein